MESYTLIIVVNKGNKKNYASNAIEYLNNTIAYHCGLTYKCLRLLVIRSRRHFIFRSLCYSYEGLLSSLVKTQTLVNNIPSASKQSVQETLLRQYKHLIVSLQASCSVSTSCFVLSLTALLNVINKAYPSPLPLERG